MNKKNKFLLFFFTILLFFNILLFLTNIWIFDNFGNVKIQEILFTLLSPTSGTDSSVVYSYILRVLLIAVSFTVLSCFIVLYTRKKSKHFKYIKRWTQVRNIPDFYGKYSGNKRCVSRY